MKRSRGRGRKSSNNSNRQMDSNGPDVKIRGTATHIYEKYQSLARDASSSGDRVTAENYLQHAEHYFRVVRAANGSVVKDNASKEASDASEATDANSTDSKADARLDREHQDAQGSNAAENAESGADMLDADQDGHQGHQEDDSKKSRGRRTAQSGSDGKDDGAKATRRRRTRRPSKAANGAEDAVHDANGRGDDSNAADGVATETDAGQVREDGNAVPAASPQNEFVDAGDSEAVV